MGEKKKLGNFVKNSLTTCNLITIYREEFYDTKDFATIIKISWLGKSGTSILCQDIV